MIYKGFDKGAAIGREFGVSGVLRRYGSSMALDRGARCLELKRPKTQQFYSGSLKLRGSRV